MSEECAVCSALAEKAERGEIILGQRCTLHGGSMTATEVKMSFTHEIAGDPKTWRARPEAIYLKCGHIISIKGTSVTGPLKECCLIAMAEG